MMPRIELNANLHRSSCAIQYLSKWISSDSASTPPAAHKLHLLLHIHIFCSSLIVKIAMRYSSLYAHWNNLLYFLSIFFHVDSIKSAVQVVLLDHLLQSVVDQTQFPFMLIQPEVIQVPFLLCNFHFRYILSSMLVKLIN